MRKNSLFFLIGLMMSCIVSVSLTACSGSDSDDSLKPAPPAPTPTPEPTEDDDNSIISLTFHNFATPNDVTILNSDTTQISVSKALAEKMGIKKFDNRRLAVWQKVSRLPFYRGIVSAQQSGDRYILNVKPIKIDEFMAGINFKYKNEMYYNSNAASTRCVTRSDGTIGEVVDPSARYVDQEGVHHPAAVLYTDLSMQNMSYAYVETGFDDVDDPVYTEPEHRRHAMTRAASDFDGDFDYATPEQGGNPSIEIIDLSTELSKKMKIPMNETDSVDLSISIPVKLKVNLWGYVDFGIFSGLEYLGVSVYGDIDFQPQVLLEVSKGYETPEENRKIKLVDMPGKTFVFFAGPVPIVIGMKPCLYLRHHMIFNIGASMGFKYSWNCYFDAGFKWDDENGFGTISTCIKGGDGFEPILPQVTGRLYDMIGFAIGGDVMLYEVAGPELLVGPKLEFDGNLKFSPFEEEGKRLTGGASVDLSLTSDVGVKLEFFGKNFGSWDTSFNLLGPYNIWKYPAE